jgi:hypothetical protein
MTRRVPAYLLLDAGFTSIMNYSVPIDVEAHSYDG